MLAGTIADELPASITVHSDKISVRLDKAKRWHMNRIEYNRILMGVDNAGSHYGSVFFYAGEKGFVGSGHVETGYAEEVKEFEIVCDNRNIPIADMAKPIAGKNIKIMKVSELRDFKLYYTLIIADNTMEEIVRVTAGKDVRLQCSYHFMHPWSTRFDEVMGVTREDQEYVRKFTGSGKFIIRENIPAAVFYDRDSGYGVVTVHLPGKNQHNPNRYIWDRNIYRKDYFVDYSNQVFFAETESVYHAKTLFFKNGKSEKWSECAWKLIEKARNRKRAGKVEYHDVLKSDIIKITGFAWRPSGGKLNRLPEDIDVLAVGRGIMTLAGHTAGGTVRFRTDSPYIDLQAELENWQDSSIMPRSGTAGFDWYTEIDGKEKFCRNIVPSHKAASGKEILKARLNTGCKPDEVRAFVLYLPRIAGIKSLKLGFTSDARLLPPLPHKVAEPIIFYGSSITQGTSASRPANAYTTMLCRAVDAQEINLGFCGSCKGENAIAEAIGSLKAAALILDYDYNAPHTEHLKKTHEPFFKKIRMLQPDLPIIILSRCTQMEVNRRNIIYRTYANALKNGDTNVYFIDGGELLQDVRESGSIDGCHPNDLGFYKIYERILPVLQSILNTPQKSN